MSSYLIFQFSEMNVSDYWGSEVKLVCPSMDKITERKKWYHVCNQLGNKCDNLSGRIILFHVLTKITNRDCVSEEKLGTH